MQQSDREVDHISGHIRGDGRRRSVLCAPASEARKVEKALASAADEVVLDLEDAVAPEMKDSARETLTGVLRSQQLRPAATIAVRVNPARSRWCHDDLLALTTLPEPPATIVLPKVESPGDLAFCDRLLDGAEAASTRAGRIGVQALIETAAGLAAVTAIAHAGERLVSLILGYADLAASLGTDPRISAGNWLPAQHAVLVAARSAGLQAIDGPYLDIADIDGLRATSAATAALGLDGRWAIHPAQIEPLNQIFSPSPEQIREADEIVTALARAEREGLGAVALNGRMLDEAVAISARRILGRAGVRRLDDDIIDPDEEGAVS